MWVMNENWKIKCTCEKMNETYKCDVMNGKFRKNQDVEKVSPWTYGLFHDVDFDFLHVRIRIAQQLHKTATKFISSCCFDKQCTITGDLLDITISQKKKTIVGLSVLSLFSPESIMCSEMFTYQMRYDIRYVWVYSMSTQYTHFSPFIAFFLKVIHYESQWTGQVGKMEIN